MRTKALLLAATMLLGGCYSFRGPEPVWSARGVVYHDSYRQREGYLFERFRQAAMAASGCTEAVAHGRDDWGSPITRREAICDRAATAPTEQQIEQFMLAGYALIFADCTDYFAHMGRNQQRARVARDAITPIGNLITGIVALRGNTAAAIPELTLFGTSAASGLDIFEQRFLFDADNIDAVRQLVLRALSEHATNTLNAQTASFEQGAINVLDNQSICTPPHILTLTRGAIREGRLEPRTTAAPGPAAAAAAGSPNPGLTTTQVVVSSSPQ